MREIMGGAWVVAPTASLIYHISGKAMMINNGARRMFGFTPDDLLKMQENYSLYTDETLIRANVLPIIREAFAGKKTLLHIDDYAVYTPSGRPSDRRIKLELNLMPLRVDGTIGEYLVAFYKDVTVEEALSKQVEANQRELEQAVKQQTILREEIEARSAPVVPIFAGILVMPLIGAIDSMRAQQIMASALDSGMQSSANTLILDITGVPVVDTAVANYILQMIRALRLIGTETIVVGISPEIAQTIVQLGLRLEDITTRADLQSGLQTALARQNLQIARRD
ncbi:MAG TPA: STAS domain-containing protein [Herpetosiphonaceae bacterium]|nr:STAS domain-containing protein [Herpetosiphonaceae bacterium]